MRNSRDTPSIALTTKFTNGRSDDPGGVVGATAPLALLAATDDQRLDLRTAALDEDADALRATELVGAERQQVDVRADVAQIDPARRLHRIGVEQRVGCVSADDAGDLGDVGDRSDLVVDRHHAHDRHVRRGLEHSGEFVGIDAPEPVDTDDPTLFAELLDDVEDRMMLDRWAHGDATVAGDRPDDRHVVALGTAASEDDFVGMAADHTGDGVPGLVDGLASAAGETVRARRVGVQLGQVRHHRVDRLGAHRRRGSMIEVGEAGLRHPSHAIEHATGQGPSPDGAVP